MGNLLYYVNPPPRLPWTDLQYTELFTSLDGIEVEATTGSVDLQSSVVSVNAQTTDGDEARIYKAPQWEFPEKSWSKKRTFKTRVEWNFEGSDGGTAYIGTGSYDDNAFFGFQVIDGKLECISKATGGQSTVEIEDFSGSAFTEDMVLEAKLFPGARIEFRKDGTLAAAISTRLPDNNAHAARLFEVYARTNTDGEKKEISVSMIMIHQKP